MPIPEHFRLELSPLADPAAIVEAGNARFSLLTDRLIRMEYSPSRQFEDHASQAFWDRPQIVPPFQTRWIGERLEIETDHLILAYQPRKLGFTRQRLPR